MPRRATSILKWSGLAVSALLLGAAVYSARTEISYTGRRGQVALAQSRFRVMMWDPQDQALQYTRFGWARIQRRRDGPIFGFESWRTVAPWGWGVQVPLWAPLAAVLAPTVWLFILARRHRFGPGRCPACGYDLRGLSPGAPCPECGKNPAALSPLPR